MTGLPACMGPETDVHLIPLQDGPNRAGCLAQQGTSLFDLLVGQVPDVKAVAKRFSNQCTSNDEPAFHCEAKSARQQNQK